MTRVVLAPDSFKGSIPAAAAAAALRDGWLAARPADDVLLRPMADGGEGTLDAFAAAVPGATRMPLTVTGPAGTPAETAWLLLPDSTAVVELAAASGIELLGGRLRPWDASTRGFGEAIAAALDHGVERLVLGIGSSASTDLGVGMLSALGAGFVDGDGAAVSDGAGGLAAIAHVDTAALRPPPAGGIVVLSDVTNPLLGPSGAAAVFGPQKGIDDIAHAEAGLAHAASLFPLDPMVSGAGAAGGTGFALLTWGARLVSGAEEIARLVGLADAVATADVVVTGEGAYDDQSAAGKAPSVVAAAAGAAGVPTVLVAGRVAPTADATAFSAAIALTDLAGSTEAALADPARWLRAAGAQLAAGVARVA
ncbi:glycerate kinase [Microbacterium sp. PM5]|uniref:glycerate kinase n=1 Tax=Microbacterium sp. PM5 TaxID=2014534 RepID=UPI000DD18093|nr:glycerate kinase [Microbacterium sp. PM5]AXA96359.1 glycerate kinase [Microbacterium sp. PM5]